MSPADEKQSPFIAKSIRCPVCKKASAQRTFRTRMFVPGEKESDTHIPLEQMEKKRHGLFG